MVVSLHACDTATDYALYKAVLWKAKGYSFCPMRQHELNGQMQCGPLNPLLKHGIIKERLAALATDSLGPSFWRSQAIKYSFLEFIDMEHTPKNILIHCSQGVFRN